MPAGIVSGLCGLGPNVIQSADILAAMWEIFAFIATLAGLTCLMGGSIGDIVATPDGTHLAQRLYLECTETARRSGHALSPTTIADAERLLAASDSPLKASMLRDLERGARTEAEHILGDMHTRASTRALDTSLLAAALTHLRVYESNRR